MEPIKDRNWDRSSGSLETKRLKRLSTRLMGDSRKNSEEIEHHNVEQSISEHRLSRKGNKSPSASLQRIINEKRSFEEPEKEPSKVRSSMRAP